MHCILLSSNTNGADSVVKQPFWRFHVYAEKPFAFVLFFNVFCGKHICLSNTVSSYLVLEEK